MKTCYIMMNKNTKISNSDIPDEVLELIPWYAIGKLSVDDQAIFQAALLKYPLLEARVQQEQQMIKMVSADKSLLEKSALVQPEERLKSVLNMIDVAETQHQSSQPSEDESFIAQLKNTIVSWVSTPKAASQYASVTVLLLSVAVLTAFVTPLFTGDKNEFIPASAVSQNDVESKRIFVNSSNTVLLVGFNGTSAELGNNAVLKDMLFKIETVPDKKGMYQISFKKPLSDEKIKQTIDALTKQKDLVWFAGEKY